MKLFLSLLGILISSNLVAQSKGEIRMADMHVRVVLLTNDGETAHIICEKDMKISVFEGRFDKKFMKKFLTNKMGEPESCEIAEELYGGSPINVYFNGFIDMSFGEKSFAGYAYTSDQSPDDDDDLNLAWTKDVALKNLNFIVERDLSSSTSAGQKLLVYYEFNDDPSVGF